MRVFFYSLLILFFLSSVFVLGQGVDSNNQVVGGNVVSEFEKLVVKEHFVTKKELKEYINSKILEYQKFTEQEISNSFGEVNDLIDSKINKLVVKLMLGVFGCVFFSGSLWYFVRKRFDRRYRELESFRFEVVRAGFPVDIGDSVKK